MIAGLCVRLGPVFGSIVNGCICTYYAKPDPAYYALEAICILQVRDWLGLDLGPRMLSGYLNGPVLRSLANQDNEHHDKIVVNNSTVQCFDIRVIAKKKNK